MLKSACVHASLASVNWSPPVPSIHSSTNVIQYDTYLSYCTLLPVICMFACLCLCSSTNVLLFGATIHTACIPHWGRFLDHLYFIMILYVYIRDFVCILRSTTLSVNVYHIISKPVFQRHSYFTWRIITQNNTILTRITPIPFSTH